MKSGNLLIRQAATADFDRLLPLFERFYREEGFEAAVPGVAGNLRQILQREDTAAFIALLDERAVGAAATSSSFGLEVGLYAELEDLFVHPDWRGRGVASMLVEAAADWARANGCSDMEIVLTPHGQADDKLAPWYKARGFTDTGRVIYERSL
ncbi:GNAT family N-acetyltransferase [Pelagibius litoralis]|uniref:GNAT family N-acetyltransferase n=2 Tax=Pelagibius litoralis TaxID=374515 RepID=A0A967EZC2_9PROT|nr:GNAT family N-acetyltransferase [Pelagibius litoralis]